MRIVIPTILLGAGLLGTCTTAWVGQEKAGCWHNWEAAPNCAQIIAVLSRQGIHLNMAEAQGVRLDVLLALGEARSHGLGNSKVDFAAVEIARDLNLDTSPGSPTVRSIVAAIGELMNIRRPDPGPVPPRLPQPCPRPMPPPLQWETYFSETLNLSNQSGFMDLMARNQFHPVQISWEDIGRNENSVWGDRISDVGIWIRRDERNPESAQLALSVRRDSNFRDKVLMVPSDRIKIHVKEWGHTVEKTLSQRLRELGLASKNRDRNVIVSNQFAIVPVPSRAMRGARPQGVPPRAAFTFSIFPYGSTNFVITDVIEGSHEAIVGPGNHQMLFANINGRKAPFTASLAEDRPDLLRMEQELKAQGMDVDVQRYYLIQIPLRRNVLNLQLSNMGTPPLRRAWNSPVCELAPGVACDASVAAPCAGAGASTYMAKKCEAPRAEEPGLDKVAIGHGEAEGPYFVGSGYQGARAEEPIRVTVVYFVTPIDKVTSKDMDAFTRAFSQWDSQAIWGGSFVTKE